MVERLDEGTERFTLVCPLCNKDLTNNIFLILLASNASRAAQRSPYHTFSPIHRSLAARAHPRAHPRAL